MVLFDGHQKCAWCRDKGVGEDFCVLKKDCDISKLFSVEQKQHLATLTYKAGKEYSKKTANSTLVVPAYCKLLGRVEGDRVVEDTPASKKKKSYFEDTPKASKKKANKSTTSDDLKN